MASRIQASRIDAADGSRHEAAFFGQPGGRRIGFTHLPAGQAEHGVVICPSVHAEFLRNYRKEALLARRLSAAGVAVQRFHYRGTGNSEGRPEDVSFATMCEDARDAASQLRARSGVGEVAFLGTRLGALVSAAASSDEPVILWEPSVSGARYFREAFRARMVRELKLGAGTQVSGDTLVEELRSTGSLDVLGYLVHLALYDSTVDLTLADAVGPSARPVLLVQVAKRTELRPEYESLVHRWAGAGFAVDTRLVSEDESWWYVGEDWKPDEERAETTALVEVTASWLLDELWRSDATGP